MAAAEKQPDKKHRHDIGEVDHGPHSTELVTKAIQIVLGAAVVGSAALVIYTVVLMVR